MTDVDGTGSASKDALRYMILSIHSLMGFYFNLFAILVPAENASFCLMRMLPLYARAFVLNYLPSDSCQLVIFFRIMKFFLLSKDLRPNKGLPFSR